MCVHACVCESVREKERKREREVEGAEMEGRILGYYGAEVLRDVLLSWNVLLKQLHILARDTSWLKVQVILDILLHSSVF